jgi:hypothetical protein
MGGFDSNGKSVDGMEVFDSKTKQITKVLVDQNNWVQVPIAKMTGDGFRVCGVPLIEKNAFILTGGR